MGLVSLVDFDLSFQTGIKMHSTKSTANMRAICVRIAKPISLYQRHLFDDFNANINKT